MYTIKSLLISALACAAILVAAMPAFAQESTAVAAPLAELKYSNKWRLEVSEGANNDGVLHFRITPKDGTPVDINVALKDGRGEDGCARDIRDAFKEALDRKTFKIEVDDGEDVLVKKRSGPDFAIQLVGSTVEGTRVRLDSE